ncbi:Fur family transcriptional regulator [Mongoliibacter ruber]|uniref:Fur family peroxide stress response transcriptional regulator n=1 Tax=Mongoliibacter ruber TaxID=1750599 RepID=A0A2T0WHR2_9BACT|nr:transcriptional repressor [Mongoliibacter ruber]PRY86250.1 Fur family peroxide stress response transcriptional regulator [Mongoliibacter ruber]
MTTEFIKNKITDSGLKFTHQRWVIYDALHQADSHPTADQVFEDIKSANPSISLGTVYKTLDSFVQTGLIQKFMDQNGVMRFDAIIDAHSHLYCKETHEIKDFRNEELEKIIHNFISGHKLKDFEVEEVSIVFKGRKK